MQDLKELAKQNKLLGVFDLTNEQYHAAPGISKSRLVLFDRTPAHYKYAIDNPKEPTDAMTEGSALHTLVLEPKKFDAEFSVMPDHIKKRGTKKFDAWIEEEQLEKQTILTATQWAHIEGMRISVAKNKKASIFLNGYHEKCFFWNEKVTIINKEGEEIETDILCKCKPDSIHFKAGVIADLKSTKAADMHGFMKQVHEYKYHVQDAFYTDGVIESVKQGGCEGLEFKEPDSFMFIAVEKESPHCVAFYDLSLAYRDEGRKLYKAYLEKYAQAVHDNSWGGYPDKVIQLVERSYMYS